MYIKKIHSRYKIIILHVPIKDSLNIVKQFFERKKETFENIEY